MRGIRKIRVRERQRAVRFRKRSGAGHHRKLRQRCSLVSSGNHRPVVGADDRNQDRRRVGAVRLALAVVDRNLIAERHRLARSKIVKRMVGGRERPANRPAHRVRGLRHRPDQHRAVDQRRIETRRYPARAVIGNARRVTHVVTVRVNKQKVAREVLRRARSRLVKVLKTNTHRTRNKHRTVVRADNRDRQRLVVRPAIPVVHADHIGQRRNLTLGKIVKHKVRRRERPVDLPAVAARSLRNAVDVQKRTKIKRAKRAARKPVALPATRDRQHARAVTHIVQVRIDKRKEPARRVRCSG